VCRFARRRGLRIGVGQIEPKPFDRRLDLGEVGPGGRRSCPGICELRPRRFDDVAKPAVALRELHFLPPPQLVPETLVSPCLRRLALERAALLLNLVDDVVHARQVLLRGFELQFSRSAAALVLRHPGRFFDQLPAVGWTGAQNLTDLALLDYGVGLHAEPGIHQEILHVAQTADLAIDQVLTLTGSIQPPHQFDVANDQRRFILLDDAGDRRRRRIEGESRRPPFTAGRHIRLRGPIPVAVAIPVTTNAGSSFAKNGSSAGDARRHACQLETHFSGSRRLSAIAAAKNHVLHAVAPQALRALLTKYPRERIDDVALAATVRADDGRDPSIEGQFGAIGKALETGDLEALQPHVWSLPINKKPLRADTVLPGSGWGRFDRLNCDVKR
jgi:hypothetical protein